MMFVPATVLFSLLLPSGAPELLPPSVSPPSAVASLDLEKVTTTGVGSTSSQLGTGISSQSIPSGTGVSASRMASSDFGNATPPAPSSGIITAATTGSSSNPAILPILFVNCDHGFQ